MKAKREQKDDERVVIKLFANNYARDLIKGTDAETSEDSKTMLEIDLKAEQDTITNYRERIRQAEIAGEFALSEKLRKIISEE